MWSFIFMSLLQATFINHFIPQTYSNHPNLLQVKKCVSLVGRDILKKQHTPSVYSNHPPFSSPHCHLSSSRQPEDVVWTAWTRRTSSTSTLRVFRSSKPLVHFAFLRSTKAAVPSIQNCCSFWSSFFGEVEGKR